MKIKKILLNLILILGIVSLMMLFSACTLERVESISLDTDSIEIFAGDFNISDYKVKVKYSQGTEEEVVLDETMMSASDLLNFYKVGNHTITINYLNRTYDVSVKVKMKTFQDIVFGDVETTYTGSPVVVSVQNVPDGATVSYPTGNSFVNAGEYQAKAIITKNDYELAELTARVVIKKADYDISALQFEEKTFTYDGTSKSIGIEGNLPQGLNVVYSIKREGGNTENGNSAVVAGEYLIQANFEGDQTNYNQLEPLTAKMKINKAVIDISNLHFEDKTEKFDLKSHSITIDESLLPINLVSLQSITYYKNNAVVDSVVDAGEYVVKAKFNVFDENNYEKINDLEAILTIEKADYNFSNIHFDSHTVEYDGQEHSIYIQGVLPEALLVSYKYSEEQKTGETNAGTYTVTAVFSNSDNNYNTPSSLTAELVIKPIEANMQEVSFDRKMFFNYQVAQNYVPTNLPNGVTIKNIVYYYQESAEIESFEDFDGKTGDFEEEITKDGYYVVVVNFEENANYVSSNPLKTLIKVYKVNGICSSGISARESADYFENNATYDSQIVLSVEAPSDITINSQQIYKVDEFPDSMDEFLSREDLDLLGVKKIKEFGKYVIITTLADSEGFVIDNVYMTCLNIIVNN